MKSFVYIHFVHFIYNLNYYHLLNIIKYQRPSPPTPRYRSDNQKGKAKKNIIFWIFKNIHSKMPSVKIQVSMSHSARINVNLSELL